MTTEVADSKVVPEVVPAMASRPRERFDLGANAPDEASLHGGGRRGRVVGRIGIYVGLVVAIVLFFVPIYWMFVSSVKPEDEVYAWPIRWIPSTVDLSNFADAWNSAPFDHFFVNSLVTSVVGTALEMGCAVLSAYAFAFVRFPARKFVFVFMLGSMMLPGHVTLLVNYITVGRLGWLNTYAGLILPGIASAFAMFLLYQQMRQVPISLIDAARIDGAGHARRLFSIVLPLSRGMLLTAALIVFIGKWNEYVWPLIVTSTSEMRTLPIGLKFLQSQEGYTNWGAVMAGAVMVSLPMLLLFFFGQRRIIGGIGAGAVKG